MHIRGIIQLAGAKSNVLLMALSVLLIELMQFKSLSF